VRARRRRRVPPGQAGIPRRPVHGTRHGIGALAHRTFIPQRSAASGAHSTDQSAVVV